ncbi:hypothetical protein [Prescottella equi]|uniref:hypothetical protein n=1 Tax=Rhodococcus hoagii TaxID=43767 RepID=UPI000D102D25|nr:hypothetical protein [Prescottella equi]AVP71348.1 hypothetical protein C7H75_25025 [Prescottella equi]
MSGNSSTIGGVNGEDTWAPPGTSGGAGGIAGLQQLTETAWKNRQKQQVIGQLGGTQVNIGAFLSAMFNNFLADLCDAITGATNGFIGLQSWSKALRERADAAMQQAIGADGKAQTAQNTAKEAVTTAATARANFVTLQSETRLVAAVPYWMSPNPYEDVSFPRANLIPTTATTGKTDSGTGGDFHDHKVTMDIAQPEYTPPSGRLLLVPVTALQDRPYSTLGFVSRAAGMNAFYAGFYRLIDGQLRRVQMFPKTDQRGNLRTGSQMFDQRLVAQNPDPEGGNADTLVNTGENCYVALLQVGGTMAALGATKAPAITPPPGTFPPAATVYIDGQTGLPETIDPNAVKGDLGWQVWACLGQPSVQYDPSALFVYDENFNRSTGSGFGPGWLTRGADQGTNGFAAVVRGNSDGYRGAIYTKPLNTDQQKVTVVPGSDPTNVGTSVLLRARSDFSSFAYANWWDGGVEIGSARGLGDRTSRKSSGWVIRKGDVVEFIAAGERYSVLVNSQEVCFWVDTGNAAVPIGTAARYAGFSLRRSFFVNSASIDNWTGQDIELSS